MGVVLIGLAVLAVLLLLIGQGLFTPPLHKLMLLLLLAAVGTFTLPELAVCGQDEGVKEKTDAPDARALEGADGPSPVSGWWDNNPGCNLAGGHSSGTGSGKEKAGRSASSFTQGKADEGVGDRWPGVSGGAGTCCVREVELSAQSP